MLVGKSRKEKLQEIIKDEDQSKKFISTMQFLKNKRKSDFQKRGNFMAKNANNLNVNLKNEEWLNGYISKVEVRQKKLDTVNERNQILVERNRETKLFLLHRRDILMQEKQNFNLWLKK
jgi:hypothetical protein